MATPAPRALTIGLVASAVLHAGLGAILATAGGSEPSRAPQGADPFFLVDIDVAPAPPEAFEPPDEVEAPAPPEAAPAESEPAHTVEPAPEPESEPEPGLAPPDAGPRVAAADAGPPDAGALAAAPAADAGPADDAGALAAAPAADAGPADDAGALAATPAGDAGPPSTPGSAVASGSRDAGPEQTATLGAPGASGASSAPPGAAADFRPYVPEGDHIAVLLRLDRLRDSPWAASLDQILESMPDYKMILGDRERTIADIFDVLFISSSDHSDVSATNLTGRSSLSPREIRDFLDHPAAPVRWSPARGGALGEPTRPETRHPDDDRVYLMPFSGWTVLTKPKHLGVLTRKRSGSLSAAAKEADLPEWLARVREVEAHSGLEESGPAVVAGFHGLAESIRVPFLNRIFPAPERVAVTLELAPSTGFLVRGTAVFTDSRRAAAFERELGATRRKLLDETLWILTLKRFNAYNALKGLSTRRRGAAISFATSISNADAKAAIEKIAAIARRFYERRSREAGR